LGGACPCCGCAAPGGARAHAIVAALRDDDLDGAMTLGLLDPAADCAACATACRAQLDAARASRRQALAARERHRARALRLERRERERAERRKPAPATDATAASSAAPAPALPPAAAAALARAKARAAANRG
jgi:ribosomal protein L12E/L44/L45/RPP1/RPP2